MYESIALLDAFMHSGHCVMPEYSACVPFSAAMEV